MSSHRSILDVIDTGDARRTTQLIRILVLTLILVLIRRPVCRVVARIIVAVVRRSAAVDLAYQSFGVELLRVGRPLLGFAHYRTRCAILGGHHFDSERLGRCARRLLLLYVTHFGVFALAKVSERVYWL